MTIKKAIGFLFFLTGASVAAYKIGFHSGCAKVVGNWEGTYITNDIINSHCYGDRNMWLDDVESKTRKK